MELKNARKSMSKLNTKRRAFWLRERMYSSLTCESSLLLRGIRFDGIMGAVNEFDSVEDQEGDSRVAEGLAHVGGGDDGC